MPIGALMVASATIAIDARAVSDGTSGRRREE
jgi:hypothetical protein